MGDTIAWTSRRAGIRRTRLKDKCLPSRLRKLSWQKAGSTLRSSRAVPHPSTNRALRRLTSEVGRDPVHSTRYGRQRSPMDVGTVQLAFVGCCFCACGAVWLVVVRCRRCAVHLSGCVLVRLLSLWSRGLRLSVQPCTCTVAILAQGTSWAVAVTQAFLLRRALL